MGWALLEAEEGLCKLRNNQGGTANVSSSLRSTDLRDFFIEIAFPRGEGGFCKKQKPDEESGRKPYNFYKATDLWDVYLTKECIYYEEDSHQ